MRQFLSQNRTNINFNNVNQVSKRFGSAFTIIELLIVIVIIGVLVAITTVSYIGITDSAKDATVASEIASAHQEITIKAAYAGATPVSRPIAYLKSPGIQKLSSTLENAQEISMYTVFDENGDLSGFNWTNIARMIPNVGGNRIELRTANSTSDTARGFYETSSIKNQDIISSDIFNGSGRHFGWITTGSGVIQSGYDTKASSRALTTHNGWNFDSVGISEFRGVKPQAVLVFNEYHDAAKREQVISWLKNEYNIN